MPTHAERQILPYKPEQLFDLVLDVAKYPEFLPWCVAARVRTRTDKSHRRSDHRLRSVSGIFTSRVTPSRPDRIDVHYEKGPFKYLNNHWLFVPRDGGTEVDFFVDFEFHSRILQAAIGVVFNEAVRRMVAAFRRGRARSVRAARRAGGFTHAGQ